MKLNNIRLLVSDFDKCFSFYKDTLGLECKQGSIGDVYASFNIGLPSVLALFRSDLMNMAINSNVVLNNEANQDKFVIVIEVDKVDESYEQLKSKGIDFITEPKDMPDWGIRVAHFRDPESNLIEIYSDL